MGNSLRDELLKVGLVNEEQLKRPRRQSSNGAKSAKRRRRTSAAAPADQSDTRVARHVLRENQRRTARFIRDTTLGGGSAADNAKKVLRRKIQELIETQRLNATQADVAYHFVKGKRIKRIYVTEEQRARLSSGEIVIAALDGNHHLMIRSAAEALAALAPQTVLCGCAESHEDGEEHPVPDDITW